MSDHPYGWWSLLPPVAAIVLAIATRRVIVSLLLGVLTGALILSGGRPLAAVGNALETHLWQALIDRNNLRVFAFTLLMGAMVGVINRSGGMRGLVDAISPWASNRRRGQLSAWLLGLIVFFDDYANTLLLGNTLRPLCDRLRISREKLAFLVDSTAAPVAGLALVSTWVAGEIGYVQDGLNQVDVENLKAIDLFVASIPYRFYALWMLLFVALVGWLGRDFGPMLRAERQCSSNDDSDEPKRSGRPPEPTAPDPATPARWYNAVVPVAMTVGVIVWQLCATGWVNPDRAGTSMSEIFGAADPYSSLVWGALAGLVSAAILAVAQRLLSNAQITEAAGAGARLMLPALAILWLASTLSTMTGNDPLPQDQERIEAAAKASEPSENNAYPAGQYRLYTGSYLTAMVGDAIPLWLLPSVVFALAAAVSFATGTSWGTMGIVMPLAVPLTYGLLAAADQSVDPQSPILLCSIGSVLAGAIFGDHCSPISDTTVLSSQASGCDHLAHVWTQLPYALVVGGIAILCGTLPIGLGAPVWLLLPTGAAAMVAILLIFGRRVQ